LLSHNGRIKGTDSQETSPYGGVLYFFFRDFIWRLRLFTKLLMKSVSPLIDTNDFAKAGIQLDAELRSLFALLDDPDPRVAEAVQERIKLRGDDVVLPLLSFIDGSHDALAKERAEQLADQFTIAQIKEGFRMLTPRFIRHDDQAFEDGAFLIARYANPRLDVVKYRKMLDEMAEQLRGRLSGLSSALEILDEVNYFFFEELHFRGNQAKFMEPENSYLDRVLDRRIGIPISLAVIYLLVADTRLRLPFSGACAPGHFLVRYDGLRSEPLFIDAFNSGTILRSRDIKRYLDSAGLPFHKEYLESAHPRSILLRMMRNLVMVFNERGNKTSRKSFQEFMRILSPEAMGSDLFMRGLEG
jgi:regulator of sirC expression with transglutaminase-like and TPR domain